MSVIGAGEGAPRPGSGGRRGFGSDLSAEISRRVNAILDAVEEEAARIRAEAQAEAKAEIDRAREQADQLIRERQARIAELSDELVAKTEAIIGRLDDAEPIHRRFERLIGALGEAAEKLAEEAAGGPGASRGHDPAAGPSGDTAPPQANYVPPRSSSFWRAVSAGNSDAELESRGSRRGRA